MKESNAENARAVLVGVYPQGGEEECERSLDELTRLLDTAGGESIARMTQMRPSPDKSTCIGSGKIKELKELCAANDVDLVVFDTELSPAQIKNVEDGLDDVSVIDRTMLILDIFARHATSAEGKLQVELAQLQYTAPRLLGKGKDMSRLGGGIGTRGPGESKLEIDRRRLHEKASQLSAELEKLEQNRQTMRAARDRSGMTRVTIVGYTNAGKSTLLNRLTDAGILAEDKLFATLDPTTRRFTLPSGTEILLTDTVGFIRKLPHHLVKAFRSTLDEAVYADILMILADASDPECEEQLEVTSKLLYDLGATNKPILYVFNKMDRCTPERLYDLRFLCNDSGRVVTASALTGEGIETLCEQLEALCRAGKKRSFFFIPNSQQGLLNLLYKNAQVLNVDYGPDGVTVEAVTDEKTRGMLSDYLVGSVGDE